MRNFFKLIPFLLHQNSKVCFLGLYFHELCYNNRAGNEDQSKLI